MDNRSGGLPFLGTRVRAIAGRLDATIDKRNAVASAIAMASCPPGKATAPGTSPSADAPPGCSSSSSAAGNSSSRSRPTSPLPAISATAAAEPAAVAGATGAAGDAGAPARPRHVGHEGEQVAEALREIALLKSEIVGVEAALSVMRSPGASTLPHPKHASSAGGSCPASSRGPLAAASATSPTARFRNIKAEALRHSVPGTGPLPSMLQPGSPSATAAGSLLPIGRTQLLASPDAGPNSALRSWCSSPGTARHGSALFVQPPLPAAASPAASGGLVAAALLAEPLQGSSRAYRSPRSVPVDREEALALEAVLEQLLPEGAIGAKYACVQQHLAAPTTGGRAPAISVHPASQARHSARGSGGGTGGTGPLHRSVSDGCLLKAHFAEGPDGQELQEGAAGGTEAGGQADNDGSGAAGSVGDSTSAAGGAAAQAAQAAARRLSARQSAGGHSQAGRQRAHSDGEVAAGSAGQQQQRLQWAELHEQLMASVADVGQDQALLDRLLGEAVMQVSASCTDRARVIDKIRVRYNELLAAAASCCSAAAAGQRLLLQQLSHAEVVLAERASEIVRLHEELAGKEFLIAEAKGRQELAETRLEERSGEFEDRVRVLEAMVQRLGCIVDTTQAELSMIGAARDAEMSLAAAKWEEALVRVEDERDELAARGRHQLNQIKEIREAMSHMRPIPRERQASCQTEQCLLDALKPATAEALVQTNPVPQLALGLELGAGLEGAGEDDEYERGEGGAGGGGGGGGEGGRRRPSQQAAALGFGDMALATEHKPKVRSRAWALKCVVQIYCDKAAADVADDRQGLARSQICEFVYGWHLHRYGLPQMAEEVLLDLIKSVKHHGRGDARLHLFGTFTGILGGGGAGGGEGQGSYVVALPCVQPSWVGADVALQEEVCVDLGQAYRRQALELYLFALQQLAYPSQLSSLFPEDPSAAAVVDKMVHVQAALRAMFKFMGCPDALLPFLSNQLPLATTSAPTSSTADPMATPGAIAGLGAASAASSQVVNVDILMQLLLAEQWSRASAGAARLAVLFASVDDDSDGHISRQQFDWALQAAAAAAAAGPGGSGASGAQAGCGHGGRGRGGQAVAAVPACYSQEQLALMWQEAVALSREQQQQGDMLQRGKQQRLAGRSRGRMAAGPAGLAGLAGTSSSGGAQQEEQQELVSVQGFVLMARQRGLANWAPAMVQGALPVPAWPSTWQQQQAQQQQQRTSNGSLAAHPDAAAAAADAAIHSRRASSPFTQVIGAGSSSSSPSNPSSRPQSPSRLSRATSFTPQPAPVSELSATGHQSDDGAASSDDGIRGWLEGFGAEGLAKGMVLRALQTLDPPLDARLGYGARLLRSLEQLQPLQGLLQHCESLMQAAAAVDLDGAALAAAELAALLSLLVLLQQLDAALAQAGVVWLQALLPGAVEASSGSVLRGARSTRLSELALPKQAMPAGSARSTRSISISPSRVASQTVLVAGAGPPGGGGGASVSASLFSDLQQEGGAPCMIQRLGVQPR